MTRALQSLRRWYRGLPRWQRWALALPAVLVGLLLLAAGVARLARRPAPSLQAAREAGRAEGEIAAEAERARDDAADLRRWRDEARARDALVDESIAADARRAAAAVPPAPEAGPAPRSEAIERWLRGGGR